MVYYYYYFIIISLLSLFALKCFIFKNIVQYCSLIFNSNSIFMHCKTTPFKIAMGDAYVWVASPLNERVVVFISLFINFNTYIFIIFTFKNKQFMYFYVMLLYYLRFDRFWIKSYDVSLHITCTMFYAKIHYQINAIAKFSFICYVNNNGRYTNMYIR